MPYILSESEHGMYQKRTQFSSPVWTKGAVNQLKRFFSKIILSGMRVVSTNENKSTLFQNSVIAQVLLSSIRVLSL